MKKKKPLKKPSAQRAASVPAEGVSWWKAGIGAALLGFALWQVKGILRLKAGQHITVIASGKVVPQGEEPGKVANPIAVEAGPDNSVFTLHRFEGQKSYFVQKLAADMSPEFFRYFEDGKKPELKDVVDLAVDSQGRPHLGLRDGRVLVLEADFKKSSELKLDLPELSALEVTAGGDYAALDALGRRVALFDATGKFKAESPRKKLAAPKRLTLASSGRLAVLDESKGGYSIKVFSPALELERSVTVMHLAPSPPVKLAAGAGDVLVINDAHGAKGVLFYHAETGRFIGQTLGVGEEPIIHPGLVAGDRLTGDFYLHFGPGLLKCRLPEF